MLHGITMALDIAQGMLGKQVRQSGVLSDKGRPQFTHLKTHTPLPKTFLSMPV